MIICWLMLALNAAFAVLTPLDHISLLNAFVAGLLAAVIAQDWLSRRLT